MVSDEIEHLPCVVSMGTNHYRLKTVHELGFVPNRTNAYFYVWLAFARFPTLGFQKRTMLALLVLFRMECVIGI